MPQAVTLSRLDPAAVRQQLPAAVKVLQSTADPNLAVLAAVTLGLRLNSRTSTEPGLNPMQAALANLILSSAALQGHMARAATEAITPELQQAIAYDTFHWPLLQDEMIRNWDLYQENTGPALGELPDQVESWNRQIAEAHGAAMQAISTALDRERFRALVLSVWGPMGMNRF